MSIFNDKYNEFLSLFDKGKTMVLSTSVDGRVSSRMVSIVLIDGLFYFQTDKTLRKYDQIISNPNVALCSENIEIEGICSLVGYPLHNKKFSKAYKKSFLGSFNRYSSLSNERLFSIKPSFIERWIYIDGVPYIETFRIEEEEYRIEEYKGE